MTTKFFPDDYLNSSKVFFKCFRVFPEIAKILRETYEDEDSGDIRISTLASIKKLKENEKDFFFRVLSENTAQRNSYLMLALRAEEFRIMGSGVYRTSRTFLEALSRMDVEIRKELLPEDFCAYFSFPENSIFLENRAVLGCYVSVHKEGPEDTLLEVSTIFSLDRLAEQEGFLEANKEIGMVSTDSLSVFLKAGQTFQKSLDTLPVDLPPHISLYEEEEEDGEQEEGIDEEGDKKFDEDYSRLYRIIANLIMYVHSQEPDVQHLKPVHLQTNRERRQAQASGVDLNNSRYPVTLVSWNFGKDREFSVDSTTVRAHLRWQPCGPGLTQTKLIWIDQHERHFKKEEVALENSTRSKD